MKWFHVLTGALLLAQPASAQRELGSLKGKGVKAPESTLRVYNVFDLVVPVKDYPFRSAIVPQLKVGDMSTRSTDIALGAVVGGGGGGGGGGFGGGGGGGGGGFGFGGGGGSASGARAGAARTSPLRFTADELVDVIVASIAPDSWSVNGKGSGTCESLGSMLVVNQTPEVQELVDALLQVLRNEGAGVTTVTMKAYWLFLDPGGVDGLTTALDKREGAAEALATSAQHGLQAELSCFDGQATHLVAGRSTSTVAGVTPVVSANAVAHDAVVDHPIEGAVLQFRATMAPKSDQCLLDIRSTVSLVGLDGSVIVAQRSGDGRQLAMPLHIDRLEAHIHQFATSLRIPTGRPILIGGMTLDPTATIRDADEPATENAAEGNKQIVLVVQVDRMK